MLNYVYCYNFGNFSSIFFVFKYLGHCFCQITCFLGTVSFFKNFLRPAPLRIKSTLQYFTILCSFTFCELPGNKQTVAPTAPAAPVSTPVLPPEQILFQELREREQVQEQELLLQPLLQLLFNVLNRDSCTLVKCGCTVPTHF